MENLVSIIIPSFNRYNQLIHAIQSIKNQTYKNTEIIVVDDGSDDINYNEKIDGVTLINLAEKNSRKVLGYPCGGYVRNIGLKIAKGEYIAFLDDDDYWLPQKLEVQVDILKKQKHFLATCSDAFLSQKIINTSNTDNLVEYNKVFWWDRISKILGIENDYPHKITKKLLYKHNTIITSSMLFKKELIDKIGYMPEYENWKGTIWSQ